MKRFPALVAHPGETKLFEQLFTQGIALCMLYRVVGTLAALFAFAGEASGLTENPIPIFLMVAGYLLYSLFLLYTFGQVTFGRRSRSWSLGREKTAWLNLRFFYQLDLAVSIAINLGLSFALKSEVVHAQYTDIFAVALITSVALWTARRGGRLGLIVLFVAGLTELLKAPLNGVDFQDLSWDVVGTRFSWLASGWIVSLGVVRLLLEYADTAARLEEEDILLKRLSRSHDTFKEALRLIAALPPDRVAIDAPHIAEAALMPGLESSSSGDIRSILDEVLRGEQGGPRGVEFELVDGVHARVVILAPTGAVTALRNLYTNIVRHSGSVKATLRWYLDGEDLLISVRDLGTSGTGMHSYGTGLSLASRAVSSLGGSLSQIEVDRGTMWLIRLPESAYEVSA